MRRGDSGELAHFALRVALAVAITLGMVTLVALLWVAADVLLLGFAGVLLAVVLRGSANWGRPLRRWCGSWISWSRAQGVTGARRRS